MIAQEIWFHFVLDSFRFCFRAEGDSMESAVNFQKVTSLFCSIPQYVSECAESSFLRLYFHWINASRLFLSSTSTFFLAYFICSGSSLRPILIYELSTYQCASVDMSCCAIRRNFLLAVYFWITTSAYIFSESSVLFHEYWRSINNCFENFHLLQNVFSAFPLIQMSQYSFLAVPLKSTHDVDLVKPLTTYIDSVYNTSDDNRAEVAEAVQVRFASTLLCFLFPTIVTNRFALFYSVFFATLSLRKWFQELNKLRSKACCQPLDKHQSALDIVTRWGFIIDATVTYICYLYWFELWSHWP